LLGDQDKKLYLAAMKKIHVTKGMTSHNSALKDILQGKVNQEHLQKSPPKKIPMTPEVLHLLRAKLTRSLMDPA